MLTNATMIGEQVSTGPAGAWFRDKLWLAYGALDGSLVVRSMNVRHDPPPTVRYSTGFTAGETTSLAVWGDRLYVLFGTAGEGYQLTSTRNGSSFTPPAILPVTGYTGIAGLAAYPGGLAVFWAEMGGGRAHLLKSGDGGASFTDTILPFDIPPPQEPAITARLDSGELLLTFGSSQPGIETLTIAAIDPADPTTVLRRIDTRAPAAIGGVALCATRYHNQAGVHVAVHDESAGAHGPYQAYSAPAHLSSVGEKELFLYPAYELSLTFDGTRTWAAWQGDGSDEDELYVGPYMTTFELPQNLLALQGTICDPQACPPDPRLVCAAIDEQHWQEAPAMIQNALRGDLVLTPGDGAGLIGTLLEQLEPRQYYDHMGIMVRDHDLVRHATMAHNRLKRRKPGRYMTGEFFGEKAPVDGFRWDVLTYGWPGTITQSVEDGFYTGFNTVNPSTGRPFNPQGDYFALNPTVNPLPRPADGASEPEREAWRRQQRFADPEYPGDEPFGITNLPNGSAYRMATGEIIEPVVVKPAPAAEAADPRIRAMLHRVADAAEQLNGHYRFYAYTDARIALDPAMFGPPVGDPIWQGKPAGAAWSAGTRPLVCSSFIWTAIQLANTNNPPIEIEGPATESPDELLASPTVDGLYRYMTDEREAAGRALHKLVAENVENDVYLALQQIEHEKRLEIDLARIGFTGLVALLAGPVAAAAALLGVTPSTITSLKLILEDMPDDVATQLCNTFARDRANEIDEHLWESPGEGLAVSPDDIQKFWDTPNPNSNEEWWHGLYGHYEKLLLTPRRYELRRVHRWDLSSGPAYVLGRALYNGEPIEGARVRFGCETTMTSRLFEDEPMYQLDLSAGRYEAVATFYWPDTDELLTGRRVVEVEPGNQAGLIDIELEDPPEWRRLIRCTGRIDVVRKVLIGTDDWSHTGINLHTTMVKAPTSFDPPPGVSIRMWSAPVFSNFAQRFNIRVDIEVQLDEDLSITVKVKSTLCEHYYDHSRPPNGDEVVTFKEFVSKPIPAGGTGTFTFDHDSGNIPPDRGHVEFKVENLRAPT
jgi:hypothetical protein